MKKLVGIIILIIVAVVIVRAVANKSLPASEVSGTAYENQYMKINIPSDWTATEAAQNPAAVNIVKGNYILYINVKASQASGVTGGRFAEISMGAPSADAVMKEQPSPPCGTQEASQINTTYKRVDLYVDQTSAQTWCNPPTNGKSVWYFSYITDSRGGYFNYYASDTPPALVATMSYDVHDANSLPPQNDAALTTALSDMTNIFKTLQIK